MKRILLLFFTSSIFGATSTWTGAAPNWFDLASWTGPIPNAVDAVAIFPGAVGMQPVLNNNAIVGSIQFNSTAPAATISGVNTLTFSVSTGNATITATTNGNTIDVPMMLQSNLVTNVTQSMILNLSKAISGTANLTIAGLGTTFLSVPNSFTGNINVSGILEVNSEQAMGALSNSVTISSATFQIAPTGSVTSARSFISSGSATFDTNGQNLTLNGLLSGSAIIKTGSGILFLRGANTYTGGTTVNAGTLNIASDSNLGHATGPLAMATGTTLQAGAAYSLGASRPISITGSVTIDTNTFSPTIASVITGSGTLNVTGGAGNILTLTGANTYSGGTTVSTATLLGNTTSLQGAINATMGGAVVFNQSSAGTYAGAYNGTLGTTLTLQGGGIYTFSGNSASSFSTTNLSNAHLILEASLGASTLNINASSNLSGTGTLNGNIVNSGKITPGTSGSGTLQVNGNVSFTPGSGTLVSQIQPLTNGLLQVSGISTLTDGILSLQFDPNLFYAITSSYTLLTAGSRVGTFGAIQTSDSSFSSTVSYTPTSVELFVTNLAPFHPVTFENSNEAAVGNNLDALSGAFLLSPDLVAIINSFAGETFEEVNRALDQMHPARISALAELQTTLGGQLLSLFHRQKSLFCGCYRSNQFWVEPFGNWLHERRQGKQIGFEATTRGVSLGYDIQFFGAWTLGFGGAYQATDLEWSRDQGYAYIKGAYGAFYSDLSLGPFYMGMCAYAGKDWYEIIRELHFTIVDRQAKSSSHAIDAGAQLTLCYFFGSPSFQLFPYATGDYLYLDNSSFSESGAGSLDLEVGAYKSTTLRAESGIGIRFIDRNIYNTFCITPLFSMGYVLELPLNRSHYTAAFSGMPITFRTEGWDMAWQLLNLRFGLALTYRCLSLDSQYIADLSTAGRTPYVNQRANFRLSLMF